MLIVYKDIPAYCNPCARVFFLHSNKRELIHHHPLLYFSYDSRSTIEDGKQLTNNKSSHNQLKDSVLIRVRVLHGISYYL